MRPEHYVTIEVLGSEKGGGFPRPVLAGAILRVLHGVFRQHPGRFALALPGSLFSGLRIFAQTREDLDLLVAAVEFHPAVRDYGRIGYPRTVPLDYSGPWKRYSRYRIPTRKSDREPDGRLRRTRIERADQKNLPYFTLSSSSSGQRFRLYFEVIENAAPSMECQPDSYGFSVASRPFSLPDLP
ncbi:MAG: type I-F CRISPR-associated endoribonuclease Cas6/Csy4 [Nitrospirae bacterium]|nr:MAG: type I-F CRISPR-associated endoribonuclease Cas6/Csy4 [Nitrospirota bacterium]